jgi:hypothetical protein
MKDREIFRNLSMTVYDPNHIPTSTAISQVDLDFTDHSSFSATIPLNNVARPSGQAGAKIGDIIDQYKANIKSESDANALRNLRNLYRFAVYPLDFKLPNSKFGATYREPWLFWKNRFLAGGRSPENEPNFDMNVVYIGSSEFHDFYIKRGTEAFSDFYLATIGGDEPLIPPKPTAAARPAQVQPQPQPAQPPKAHERSRTPRSSVVPPPDQPSPPQPSGTKFLLNVF